MQSLREDIGHLQASQRELKMDIHNMQKEQKAVSIKLDTILQLLQERNVTPTSPLPSQLQPPLAHEVPPNLEWQNQPEVAKQPATLKTVQSQQLSTYFGQWESTPSRNVAAPPRPANTLEELDEFVALPQLVSIFVCISCIPPALQLKLRIIARS